MAYISTTFDSTSIGVVFFLKLLGYVPKHGQPYKGNMADQYACIAKSNLANYTFKLVALVQHNIT